MITIDAARADRPALTRLYLNGADITNVTLRAHIPAEAGAEAYGWVVCCRTDADGTFIPNPAVPTTPLIDVRFGLIKWE